MARSNVPTQMINPNGGLNLTDSGDWLSFLATGPNNGMQFEFNPRTLVFLRNLVASPATATVILKPYDEIENQGGDTDDPTFTIALNKLHILRNENAFVQTTGLMAIDCDSLIEILVIQS